jgi:hypothetical protein
MKVIFLDIDGVLNNDETKSQFGHGKGWDPILISRLVKIIKAVPDVGIVMSSTWRVNTHFSTVPFQFAFATWGIQVPIIGCTPTAYPQNPYKQDKRHVEISAWLDAARATGKKVDYIVLDDEKDAGPGHEKFFVNTKKELGLTEADVTKAIKLLQRVDNESGTDRK